MSRIVYAGKDGSKYFGGAATIVIGNRTVHSKRWPLVDRYVTMHGMASFPKKSHTGAGKRAQSVLEMVHVSYTVPSLTLGTLASVIGDSLGIKDGGERMFMAESLGVGGGGSVLDCEKVMDALRKADMEDKVCETTRLLYMRDVLLCAQVYKNPYLMGKLNWRTVRKIAEIVRDCRNPEQLCFPDLINLKDNLKIPRLSVERLLTYMQSEGIPPPPDAFLDAVRLYQNEFLHELEDNGHCFLPESVVMRMKDPENKRRCINTLLSDTHKPLVEDVCSCKTDPITGRVLHASGCVGTVYFTARTHAISVGIAERLVMLHDCSSRVESVYAAINKAEFLEGLETRLGHKLDTVQAAAMYAVFSEPVVIVTGSPGSGKSKCFIRGVKELHDKVEATKKTPKVQGQCGSFMLVAPTGMAVANVSVVCGGLGDTMDMVFTKKERYPDGTDYSEVSTLVVEEASAADEERLYRLLRVLPNLVQIILVFDNNQLGPFGQGFPSRDLLTYFTVHPDVAERTVFEFTTNHRFNKGDNSSDMAHNARAVLERRDDDLRYSTPDQPNCWSRGLILVDSMGDAVRTARDVWMAMREAYKRENPPQLMAHRNETVDAINRVTFAAVYSEDAKENRLSMDAFEECAWTTVAKGMRIVFTKNHYNKPKKLAMLEKMAAASEKSLSQENTEALMRIRENAKRRLVIPDVKTRFNTGALKDVPACLVYEQWKRTQKPPNPPKEIVSNEVRNGEMWTVGSIQRVARDTRIPSKSGALLFSTQDARYSESLKITDASGIKWVFTDDVPLRRIADGSCITVHKAQGSQYTRAVYVVEDRESEYLSLNLLYTALTRAQEQVVVVCKMNEYSITKQGRKTYPLGQLSKIIKEHVNVERYSGLGRVLKNPTQH